MRCKPRRTFTRTPRPSLCASRHLANARTRLFLAVILLALCTLRFSSRALRSRSRHLKKLRRCNARRIRLAMFMAYIVFFLIVSWYRFHTANTCRVVRRWPRLDRANFDISFTPRSRAPSSSRASVATRGVPPRDALGGPNPKPRRAVVLGALRPIDIDAPVSP